MTEERRVQPPPRPEMPEELHAFTRQMTPTWHVGRWTEQPLEDTGPGCSEQVRYVRHDVVRKVDQDWHDLVGALKRMVHLVEAAGVMNLTNGVQLGPTAWGVKMTAALECAHANIEHVEKPEQDK